MAIVTQNLLLYQQELLNSSQARQIKKGKFEVQRIISTKIDWDNLSTATANVQWKHHVWDKNEKSVNDIMQKVIKIKKNKKQIDHIFEVSSPITGTECVIIIWKNCDTNIRNLIKNKIFKRFCIYSDIDYSRMKKYVIDENSKEPPFDISLTQSDDDDDYVNDDDEDDEDDDEDNNWEAIISDIDHIPSPDIDLDINDNI